MALSDQSDAAPCPHCGKPSGPGAPTHVCADCRPWTRAERDEWRDQARRWWPAIAFAPSTAQFAARFGHRSQRQIASDEAER